MNIGFHFGAMCDPLEKQAEAQGVIVKDVAKWQRAADAIVDLMIFDILTDTEVYKARQRLMKRIIKNCREVSK